MPPTVDSFQNVQDRETGELSTRPGGIPDPLANRASNSSAETRSAFQIPDFKQPTKLRTPFGNEENGAGPERFAANVSEADTLPPKVQPRTPLPTLSQAFKVLQQWEGTVVSIEGDHFEALVRDVVDRRRPEERATIVLADIFEDDQPLIKPGAVFFWTIGYELKRAGRKTSSVIRFRRLPKWSRFELDRANKKAQEFDSLLGDSTKSAKNGSS